MGAAYGVEGSIDSTASGRGSTGWGPRQTDPNHCEKIIPAAIAIIVKIGHLGRTGREEGVSSDVSITHRRLRLSGQTHPRHGPVIATVSPAVCKFTNSVEPSGLNVTPANSPFTWLCASV
jgi:hypothetical protein